MVVESAELRLLGELTDVVVVSFFQPKQRPIGRARPCGAIPSADGREDRAPCGRSFVDNGFCSQVYEAIEEWANGNLHELAFFQALTALDWYVNEFMDTLGNQAAGYDEEDGYDDDGLDASGVIELGFR